MKIIKYSVSDYHALYIYIFDIKLSKFMKQKPPCKNCLKEVMCINIVSKKLSLGSKYRTIQIRTCEDLRRFIINNRKFKTTAYIKGMKE